MGSTPAVILAAAALLLTGFDWGEVPQTKRVTRVQGNLEVAGVPIRAWEVVSAAGPEELLIHFEAKFIAAGFYLPPTRDHVKLCGGLQLTGFDPDTKVSYTVMLRPAAKGITKLILGEASWGAAHVESDGALPLMPGAQHVITTDVEFGRMVAFTTTATEAELVDFYRATLTAAGWRETEPRHFVRGKEVVQLHVGKGGRVALMLRGA